MVQLQGLCGHWLNQMLGKEWEVAADGFASGVTEIDDAKCDNCFGKF